MPTSFPPSKSAYRAFRALGPYLRPQIPLLILVLVCILGNAISTAALVPLAQYAAHAFAALTPHHLARIVLGLLGLYWLKGLFIFGQTALAQRAALSMTARLRDDTYAQLITRDLRFFVEHRPADLSSRLVQDLALVRDALAASIANVVPSLAIVLYSLGYAIWANWRLALATLVAAPLVGWTLNAFGYHLNQLSERAQERVADIFVRATETLTAIGTVRAFGQEKREVVQFADANARHRDTLWRAARIAAMQPAAIAVIQTSAIAAVFWVGGQEILAGRMQPADLLAFAAAIAISIDPTLALAEAWGRIQVAGGALSRVIDLHQQVSGLSVARDPHRLQNIEGGLELKDVTFGYTEPVLRNINLTIRPGEVVGLVGFSGGGKSTLAALLLRLYDPWQGGVYLDGIDLRNIAMEDLRQAIAWVPQDPFLFGGTIAQNVAYGRPDATQAEIEAACRAAFAHDFILSLSAGYQTDVGERGTALSGGQRQRIAIARSLVLKPRVLILDEATSALDAESARQVRAGIARHLNGGTLIIVAHRLEQIVDADCVYVIESGRVVESGSPQALSAQGGAFSRLLLAAQNELSAPQQ